MKFWLWLLAFCNKHDKWFPVWFIRFVDKQSDAVYYGHIYGVVAYPLSDARLREIWFGTAAEIDTRLATCEKLLTLTIPTPAIRRDIEQSIRILKILKQEAN